MLKLKNVSFSYGENPVLKNINFEVNKGEHISVIGESGCGKSTLLQLIYGLHHTRGTIKWKEQELLGPNFNLVPGEPFIKYLAQDFDLMLPLTAAENVGKYLSNMYPRKKKQRVKELLKVVEMEELADKKAGDLSGGQQQRVALARALAKEPELLLLDEPFSHIDHFRKNNLRRKVYGYLKDNDITCITATHDSTDALSFADKTIVIKNGSIYAQDPPHKLYNHPPNKYVASLFGDINEVMLKDLSANESSSKKILLYPNEIEVVASSELKATVLQSYFKGSNFLVKAKLNGRDFYFNHTSSLEPESIVSLKVPMDLILSRLKN